MTAADQHPNQRPDQPTPPGANADETVSADGLVLAGGKLDSEAVRRAVETARASRRAREDADPDAENESDDESAHLPRVTFTLQRDLKKRLDRYLTDRIGFMSRTQLQRLIEGGGVLVNNRLPKASTVLRAGDVVEVVVPEPPAKNIQPEDIPLDVLFEDEHLIVLNKRPDIIVHPARSHLKGTLLSALTYHFMHRSPFRGSTLSSVGTEFARPGVVHRLDRHTSGCIVFAKTEEAHWKLGHQFEHRTVEKRYLAVAHGILEPLSDAIDLPIGTHPSREKGYREKYVVRHDELGKPSLTIYRARECYRAPPDPEPPRHAPGVTPAPRDTSWTLVELELRTGRTHQIRVHLSHLGWPIVGDDMYGGRPYPEHAPTPLIARQALHAALLAFEHPISGTPMRFTAPLRGDMAALVRHLRANTIVERPEIPGTMIDLAWAVGPDGTSG